MNTKFRIIMAAVLILSIGLTLFLQQTINVSAQDVIVTIDGPEGPINQATFTLTITFNGDVEGFTEEDIVILPEGETDNFTVINASEYEVDIINYDEGTITVDVPEDVVDGGNLAATQFSIVYDITAPTVIIESANPDPTGQDSIFFTISFDELIKDFEVAVTDFDTKIVLTNATIGPIMTDDGTQEIDLAVLAEDFGDVTIEIPADIFSDLAGNKNAETTKKITFVDQPWVAIEQAVGQLDPTPVPPILFDVTFSEAVIGFEAADVDLTGSTALGELIVQIELVPETINRYTVSVTGMTGPGVVVASIPADVVEDIEENPNLPSTSEDNEVTFEGPVPEILAIERVQTNPTKAESVNFYVTFSEAVNGVEAADFVLTTTGEITGAMIQYVVGADDQRFVSVFTGAGVGTLRLDVAADAQIFDADDFAMIDLPYTMGEVYDVRIESFADVPLGDWAWLDIEILFAEGLTDGYPTTPLTFGPEREVTRAEMAKFILQAIYGGDYEPDLAEEDKGVFADVDYENEDLWYLDWVDDLYAQGLTNGCNPTMLEYCPDDSVTRAEMAKFLLVAINEDPAYVPVLDEEDQGVFEDVDYDADLWYLDWIDALYKEEITTGCNEDPLEYCPEVPVLRKEIAAFLVRAFDLGE